MYDYASLKKLDNEVATFEPSDNLIINGQPLNRLIEGYRHLTVSGRGILGRDVSTTNVPGRRGVWVDKYSDEERTIEIKYQLTAETSSEMRDKFAKLNKILRTHAQSGFLEISFKDEPDFIYYGYFNGADSFEETSLSIVSKFSLLIPDGYKKKSPQTSTGPISLIDAVEVFPESITVTVSKTTDRVQIVNGSKVISFSGSYSADKDIVILFDPDEVKASYDGRNILSELDRFSPLELFTVRDGDNVTAVNATIKRIVWRDERA